MADSRAGDGQRRDPPEAIERVAVLATVVGGLVVYEAK
jgi:hypothetical protein